MLVPFAPGAGRTPRRIVIERQKRLFALQDVGALLLDLGVDVNEPDTLTDGGMEPLESFDDTEYEGRPIEEWMALADDASSGGPRGVPARFLHEGAWRECVVTSYDDESREFSLTFSEAPGAEIEEGTATRINICSPPRTRSSSRGAWRRRTRRGARRSSGCASSSTSTRCPR